MHPQRGDRYPMEQDDGSKYYASKMVYDGKRMRKAVVRRTVDYNASLLNYIHNRSWQKRPQENPVIRSTFNHILSYMPPREYPFNPSTAIPMKFVHTSANKVRCPINVVKWTPEGKRLITGSASGEFTLWNGFTFNFETIQQAHDSAIRSMSWNRAGSWMISGDHAGTVKIWMPNMNNLKRIQAHKEPVRDISFSPTDTKFATCSDDGSIKIWDFNEAIEERCLTGHGWDVRNAQWHPTKNLLASGSKDNLVKLWDAKTGINLATLHGHKNTILDLKWNQNGNWLLTAGKDQCIRLFDIRSLKEIEVIRGHKKEVMSLAWHPHHESFFASGGTDGSIFFWHLNTDSGTSQYGSLEAAHDGIVWSLDWHPVGHILASGSNDNTSRFWTRSRPGDVFNDKFAIGKAASEALGVKDVEKILNPFGQPEDEENGSEDEVVTKQPSVPPRRSFGTGGMELPGLSRHSRR